MLTWGHLRHSHLWIPFRGSPASCSRARRTIRCTTPPIPAHFDKNLGFALAVWDWAFGTLHIPAREREVQPTSASARNIEDYATVGRSLARPFAQGRRDAAPPPLGRAAGRRQASLKPYSGKPCSAP